MVTGLSGSGSLSDNLSLCYKVSLCNCVLGGAEDTEELEVESFLTGLTRPNNVLQLFRLQ